MKKAFIQITELLKQPFTLLNLPRHRWILILFTVSFSIFFVNVFVPFNINGWSKDSGFDQFLRLSGFGIIGGMVLTMSQFGIRKIAGVKNLCIGTFIAWFLGELIFMAASFLFYQSRWDISISRFLHEIPDSFKYTLLGILIPYSLSLLFISQMIHQSKLKQLKDTIIKPTFDTELLNFPDEKGIIRFSIGSEQILYIESADNYVILYYLNGNKPAKQILRNSMKNIEELLINAPIKRCHRSFMVNLQKIEFVDYQKSKCQVKLKGIENFIPVSRKFYPEFRPYFH